MLKLVRRLDEGESTATRLRRELQISGFRGGIISVRACPAAPNGSPPRMRPVPGPVWRRPSPRQTVQLLLTGGERGELDRRFLDNLRAEVREIGRAAAEVRAFTGIVHHVAALRERVDEEPEQDTAATAWALRWSIENADWVAGGQGKPSSLHCSSPMCWQPASA